MKVVGLSSLIDLSGWKEKKSRPTGKLLVELSSKDHDETDVIEVPLTKEIIETLMVQGKEFLAAEEEYKKEQEQRLIHMVDASTKSWSLLKKNICIDKVDTHIVTANMFEHIRQLLKITEEYCGELPETFLSDLVHQEKE